MNDSHYLRLLKPVHIFQFIIFTLAFPLNLLQAQTGFPDWQASVMQWAEAGKDTSYYRSDNSSTLAWGETYNLQCYNIMYQVDSDTIWLHKLAEHGFAIMNSATDVPTDTIGYHPLYEDGYRGWGTRTYTDEYDEYLVHDGHFCTELAKFVRIVYQDEISCIITKICR